MQARSTPRGTAAQRLRARPAVAAFLGVWSATFLCFLSIGAVLPVLPRYVKGPIGAGDIWVGVVIGCFAFAAIVGRPIGGRLADRVGRRTIVVTGLLIASLAGLMYLLPLGVGGLIAARLVLGVGDGWVFTAGATWIIDLAPQARRGHAIGMFGLSIWGGLTAGPLFGELLLSGFGYDGVWVFAAVMPLLGALVATQVPERPPPIDERAGEDAPQHLVPRPVIPPGIALALANTGYGTVAGFVVLHLDDRGVGHGTVVFTAFAAAVVVSRLVAGTLPDRLGARRTAIAAGLAETMGLVMLAAAHSFAVALAGGIVMGSGFSLLFPSLAVIAVERISDRQRGAALGAFTAFFDAGVGVGAPVAGLVAAVGSYGDAFWFAAVMALAGVVVSWRLKPAHTLQAS